MSCMIGGTRPSSNIYICLSSLPLLPSSSLTPFPSATGAPPEPLGHRPPAASASRISPPSVPGSTAPALQRLLPAAAEGAKCLERTGGKPGRKATDEQTYIRNAVLND